MATAQASGLEVEIEININLVSQQKVSKTTTFTVTRLGFSKCCRFPLLRLIIDHQRSRACTSLRRSLTTDYSELSPTHSVRGSLYSLISYFLTRHWGIFPEVTGVSTRTSLSSTASAGSTMVLQFNGSGWYIPFIRQPCMVIAEPLLPQRREEPCIATADRFNRCAPRWL